MAVFYRQETDGEVSIPEEELQQVGPHEKRTPLAFLKLKAKSAEEKGWTVEWDGDRAFHAWKEYDEGPVRRKDRYFRVA